MRPKKPVVRPQNELFHIRLEVICNPSHPLVKLADRIEWSSLDEQFASLYAEDGRPATATRMMIGLTLLQSLYKLSEDDVVNRWPENPYWQYLCGETFFQRRRPIVRSGLSKWRKRIKSKGMEALLQQTLAVGLDVGAVKPTSLKRVSVDTTVQPKAIAHPTDARLFNRSRERLVRLARRQGVTLRQSYRRKGPQAVLKAGRYAHARQTQRMRKQIKRLRTYLGRVIRDIERKVQKLPEALQQKLHLAKRLLKQQRSDSNKLYSLHEPQVAYISKGKAHKKYEFGNKVSICVTNREGFILGAQGLEGNPYTLKGALDQVTELTGVKPERCYVDRGYRGHGVTKTQVFLSGQRRNVTPTIKREMKRRSAIEAVIGHQKTEGRLGWNRLRGVLGDQINALMAAIGYNLSLILKALSFLLQIFKELLAKMARLQNEISNKALTSA